MKHVDSVMPRTWGNIRREKIQKNNNGDLQSCIDIGQIMEKIQRDTYIRQQKSIEQTEGVAINLLNWKKDNDADMKSLEIQMELLKKRREQIQRNSTEMTILANQLRQKLMQIQESKKENKQVFGEEEEMQS